MVSVSSAKKRGEIFEDDGGSYTFVCCLCNVTNVGLKEVEDHLNSHVETIKMEQMIEQNSRETIAVLDNKSPVPSDSHSVIKSEEWSISCDSTEFPNNSIYDCTLCKKTFSDNGEYQKHNEYHTLLETIDSILDSDAVIPIGETTKLINESIKTFNKTKKSKVINSLEKLTVGSEYSSIRCRDREKESESVPKGRRKNRNSTGPYYQPIKFDQYKCDICGRLYTKGYLHKHLLSHLHIKPHKCTMCSRSFTDSSNLRSHMNRHNQVKPSKCNVCSKAFCTESELKLHLVTHSKERNYICPYCGKRFGNSGGQTTHIRRTHMKDNKFVCNYEGCGKKFFFPGQLESHKRNHTFERPLKCLICDKSFANRKVLSHHRHLHNTEKIFQCKFCGQKFAQSSGRRGHERRVHGAV